MERSRMELRIRVESIMVKLWHEVQNEGFSEGARKGGE